MASRVSHAQPAPMVRRSIKPAMFTIGPLNALPKL